MERVKELCVAYFNDSIYDFNCLSRYTVAERFGLQDLMSKCLNMASYTSSDSLEDSKTYEEMKPEVKVEICMSRIKKLEKTLQQYITTCSSLVKKNYEAIADKLLKDVECDKKEKHPRVNSRCGSYVNFDVSCECCMRRLKNVGHCEIYSFTFKEPLKKLYDLEHENTVVIKTKLKMKKKT
jgi:hypothetical protein